MTNDDHNKYLAWAFLGHGLFQMLIAFLLLAVLIFAMTIPGQPGQTPPIEFLLMIFGFMFVFQMLFVGPSFVAAYGLLKRKSWARIASIVAAVVSAMNVPFGTLACVYALWFFLGDNWKEIYQEYSADARTTPRQLAEEREIRWTGYHTNEHGETVFHPVDPPDWR